MTHEALFENSFPHSLRRPFIMGTKGGVSSDNYYATKAGLEILAKGGNAADAAVAVSLALGVTAPYHSGIGGGCFTMYYDHSSGQITALDACGTAPSHAHRDMFLNKDGNVDPSWELFDGKTVVAPTLYRALEKLNRDHGSMSLEVLSAPAIRLAREGFSCGFLYEYGMYSPLGLRAAEQSEYFRSVYMKAGHKYHFGDRITNPDLADTMENTAKNGVGWFYSGAPAVAMAECVRKRNGILTEDDIRNCTVKARQAVRGSFNGYEIVSMPPPSSGGAHLIQMLNILERFDLKRMGHNSAEYLHILCETIKIMFADRSAAMGDPDYVKVDVERIISKEYAAECASRIDPEAAKDPLPSEGIEAEELAGNTAHFSVIDKDGNMAAQTQTIRSYWGSSVMCNGYGFVLNNAMSDFSAKAGTLTTQGLVYGNANSIEGGKTPLSSMSPTLVFKNGQPVMAVGAAGGPRIIMGTLQLLLNVLVFGMNLDEALQAGYINCLSAGQGLEYEQSISPDTIRILENKGHKTVPCSVGYSLRTLVNGVMLSGNGCEVCSNNRHDGCGGVLFEDNTMAFHGMAFWNDLWQKHCFSERIEP